MLERGASVARRETLIGFCGAGTLSTIGRFQKGRTEKQRSILMGIWTWLFGCGHDDRERHKRDASRKISPAMPMAGAGAELSGQSDHSETEENLKRAAENDRRPQ
jgi:hypothetical protein